MIILSLKLDQPSLSLLSLQLNFIFYRTDNLVLDDTMPYYSNRKLRLTPEADNLQESLRYTLSTGLDLDGTLHKFHFSINKTWNCVGHFSKTLNIYCDNSGFVCWSREFGQWSPGPGVTGNTKDGGVNRYHHVHTLMSPGYKTDNNDNIWHPMIGNKK